MTKTKYKELAKAFDIIKNPIESFGELYCTISKDKLEICKEACKLFLGVECRVVKQEKEFDESDNEISIAVDYDMLPFPEITKVLGYQIEMLIKIM